MRLPSCARSSRPRMTERGWITQHIYTYSSLVLYGMEWNGMAWHVVVLCGSRVLSIVLYSIVWYSRIQYDVE